MPSHSSFWTISYSIIAARKAAATATAVEDRDAQDAELFGAGDAGAADASVVVAAVSGRVMFMPPPAPLKGLGKPTNPGSVPGRAPGAAPGITVLLAAVDPSLTPADVLMLPGWICRPVFWATAAMKPRV